MPSPIGHALGGVSAGWLVDGARRDRQWLRQAILFAAIGMLPDIDLVFGWHSGPTHSIGAALFAGLLTWIVVRLRAYQRDGVTRLAFGIRHFALPAAVFASYASHVLLDWAGEDTTAPYGVMALWPFSREYFISPLTLMPAISRRYWLPGFFVHNLRAVLFEIAVFGPVAAIVWVLRRSRRAPSSET